MLFAFVLQISLIGVMEVNGQTVNKIANGKTYVYDNAKRRVYNASQLTKAVEKPVTEGFEVKNYSLVAETFRNILSANRLKEHSNDMVAVTFVCSKDGKIDHVKFVFAKAPFLSVDEIESLEQSFLSQSFDIKSVLEEGQTVIFTIPCFFSRI